MCGGGREAGYVEGYRRGVCGQCRGRGWRLLSCHFQRIIYTQVQSSCLSKKVHVAPTNHTALHNRLQTCTESVASQTGHCTLCVQCASHTTEEICAVVTSCGFAMARTIVNIPPYKKMAECQQSTTSIPTYSTKKTLSFHTIQWSCADPATQPYAHA